MRRPFYEQPGMRLFHGDVLDVLKELPEQSVHVIVTSPPYLGLRIFGVDSQLGLESSPDEFVTNLVEVFRECRRVLRDDGILWCNLGDSYAGSGCAHAEEHDNPGISNSAKRSGGMRHGTKRADGLITDDSPRNRNGLGAKPGLKPLDLIGIPWRVALALQQDGWYLRSAVTWCLSGGTYVYARTEGSEGPMMIRDIARLKPGTVRLWNGERWTVMLGASRTQRQGNEIELVLRSGERISCTPSHRFPTERGLLEAKALKVGDRLQRVRIEDGGAPPSHLDSDAAWFAGLYLAEGSKLGTKGLVIAGHAKEEERWERVERVAQQYGGSATKTIKGNSQTIRVYGKMLVALIDHLVSGHTAKDKGLSAACWQYGNSFLTAFLEGYLSGDGGWDEKNQRWRLGFTRNYNLERDLRAICARLGYHLVINLAKAQFQTKHYPAFRGELRLTRSGYRNEECSSEIKEIRKARARNLYDVGVEGEPHVFALASGILTHNSKPAPMPESVSGTRWERHRVKVKAQVKNTHYKHNTEGRRNPVESLYPEHIAEYIPCPGCKVCEKNDGLVLRKGSWRPSRSSEMIFMLTKTADYFADGESVREPLSEATLADSRNGTGRHTQGNVVGTKYTADNPGAPLPSWYRGKTFVNPAAGRNLRDVWVIGPEPFSMTLCKSCKTVYRSSPGKCRVCGGTEMVGHFAAFPTELPKKCILASTSEKGVCPACGRQWARVVGKRGGTLGKSWHDHSNDNVSGKTQGHHSGGLGNAKNEEGEMYQVTTLGWRATCEHGDLDPVPAVVLDPFMGSGSTAVAARELGRHSIGIDLNPDYLLLGIERNRQAALL